MPRKSKATTMKQLVSAMAGASVHPRRRKGGAKSGMLGRSQGYTGKGFYKGFGQHLGQALGGGLGALLGNAGAGAAIGGALGKLGAKATGWGKYNIVHNSLIASIPQIRNPKKEGMTQIRHCEYIGDVWSSADFKVQYALPINAAQAQTFPWASKIAQNFTQYEMNGAMFEFRSTSGDATGSNTALGSVILATNYDSVLPAFTNKQQMLNQEFSIDVKPSQNVIHPIECANSQSSVSLLYTRTGAVPPNTDQRLYDLGTFYLATQGNQLDADGNPVNLGELWITYDILLAKPLLSGPAADASLAQFTAGAQEGTAPFPLLTTDSNSLGMTLTTTTAGKSRFTFPDSSQGKYMISITGDCSSEPLAFTVSDPAPAGFHPFDLYRGVSGQYLTQSTENKTFTYSLCYEKANFGSTWIDLASSGSGVVTASTIVVTEISSDAVPASS